MRTTTEHLRWVRLNERSRGCLRRWTPSSGGLTCHRPCTPTDLRRPRLARQLLRARGRAARVDYDQPRLHPRGGRADPASAALPPGRRSGARPRRRCHRPARQRWHRRDDPPDRGEGMVGLRRTLGRIRVLLHADPAGARPGRRRPDRACAREPRASAELERQHDPRVAGCLSRTSNVPVQQRVATEEKAVCRGIR
jgi:hypothetical protein